MSTIGGLIWIGIFAAPVLLGLVMIPIFTALDKMDERRRVRDGEVDLPRAER